MISLFILFERATCAGYSEIQPTHRQLLPDCCRGLSHWFDLQIIVPHSSFARLIAAAWFGSNSSKQFNALFIVFQITLLSELPITVSQFFQIPITFFKMKQIPVLKRWIGISNLISVFISILCGGTKFLVFVVIAVKHTPQLIPIFG